MLSTCSCCEEGCEKKVSGVVKGVHARLRKKLKEADGDYERIWLEHCEDEASLDEYAFAMQHLATEHWSTKHPDDRIKWCHRACRDYFFRGGMNKAFAKDKRRRQHQQAEPQPLTSRCDLTNSVNGNVVGGSGDCDYSIPLPVSSNQYNTISLPVPGPLRLLDVGSCFNPFIQYEEFLSVGIDISPAVDSVHKCDFLNLQLQPSLECAPDTVDTYLRTLKSPVEVLPRETFHVVVFSLLLSYFPSPYQRWICCQKAHQLLQLHGLLLIITPDSSHQNRNAAMVKSWRKALESLGFRRWLYVKDTHLHYMAFRKVSLELSGLDASGAGPDLLYIPQDFNEDLEESVFVESFPRSEEEERIISEGFLELPGGTENDTSSEDDKGEEVVIYEDSSEEWWRDTH
ncbi:probable methyltransferase BMT2 homolog isoform X2 [Acanthaster planci]|uniref:S-adenosylmethionine sensor upstream of mTORC1 n=1 Tax=Acanthaster planci TaxID=133434 RepID=A0A8B7XKA1_ACAPL|nr:probable methyltransferase BMT2 homolog isoform X2 [Acanthaster planci]XP_022081227.1 probable methyltransferase BMT2 homolog isoform X2 [Acanthaster planci]XP_022081228.1 probable methyltransferase BMT2 homolog isoform X2 [Acanthaster planci]XP_022081229.1 probable methyltransferase BMT2 homolog isoform X2 [Acanthaster planci]XP_022081230.1 probable methyltransferase BMT2 homolog isoform X2 [Acanthaster planci]XP_022081231.1 probable methyltransferase BMT2 homolog isoform X2 [Acanthaster p